ncbi:hypothetical protein RFI_28489, partial [Reticulomyxa filosa]
MFLGIVSYFLFIVIMADMHFLNLTLVIFQMQLLFSMLRRHLLMYSDAYYNMLLLYGFFCVEIEKTLEESTNKEQSASETLNVQTGGSRLSNELFYKTVTKRSDLRYELLDDVISRNNDFLFSLQKLNASL